MARSKMEGVLKELAHVIGEETVSSMTGPIATPLGKSSPEEVKSTSVPSVDDPEGTAPLGKGTEQKGGDASFYQKETKKSDFPYAKPGKTEGKGDGGGVPKVDDPDGKSVIGNGTEEKGGESDAYGDEKEVSKYPHEFDNRKPGVKNEESDPLAELEALQKLAEEDPAPSAPVGEVPAEPEVAADAPPADPAAEVPAEEPAEESSSWELYLHTPEFDVIGDRAMAALQPVVSNGKAAVVVKFEGSEQEKNAAIDALTASGFSVIEVEKEGEDSDDEVPAAEPAPDMDAPADGADAALTEAKKKKKKHGKR